MTDHTSISRVIYDACCSNPMYQLHMKFEVPSFTNSKDVIGVKFFRKWVT